jgi:hypothetical protein
MPMQIKMAHEEFLSAVYGNHYLFGTAFWHSDGNRERGTGVFFAKGDGHGSSK